ncbi:MAG: HAD hydrolase-like protein [Gemmatimonadaceae bacterium]
MRIVLFDIDGTLLTSGGAGRRSMERALTEVFGSAGSGEYHYGGKTDRQIVRDLMRREGFTDKAIDAQMDQLLDSYVSGLATELESGNRTMLILDGVLALLDALDKEDRVVIGLLTGNIETGARAKLNAAGIDPSRFRVNAYGSDRESRPELPAIAQRRASELLGVDVEGNRLVIIGDTPHDIKCGEAIGARAIAVATGGFTVEELAAYEPYALFETLADTDAVLSAIMNA